MRWRNKRAPLTLAPARRAGVALLIVALAGLVSLVPAAAQRPNGGGLVIRHGDGTLVEIYVQFDEDSISGEELLNRSGLDVSEAPFGGLGAGVCSISGEGCPSDNCYCKSYSNPAYYWRYYALQGGGWQEQPRGPSSRTLRDGDVDGWSWTAGDANLPDVTIDDIAAANGVDRNAPDPTAIATATTIPPTDTPEPPPTATTAPPTAPTATQAPPTATTAPITTPAAMATIAPVATVAPIATIPPPAPTATGQPRATAVPTRAAVAAAATATTVAPRTPTAVPTTLGVVIPPSGTPEALQPQNTKDDGSSNTSYVIFGAMALAVVAVGGLAVWRRRGSAP